MRDHILVVITLLLAYFAVNVWLAVRVRVFTMARSRLALVIYSVPFWCGVHSSCWELA